MIKALFTKKFTSVSLASSLLNRIFYIGSLLLIPAAYGTEERASDYPSRYKEKARISWKAGASVSSHWEEAITDRLLFQFPVMGEVQLPFNSQFSWLFQAGGGLMIGAKTTCHPFFIPEPPSPSFDSDFFKKNYKKRLERATNKNTCPKMWETKFIPYFIGQTGFKYGSNLYGALQAGIILSVRGEIGWTGELLIGKELGWMSLGVRAVFINNSLYYGLVFYLGNVIKSWWAEQSL